MSTAMSTQVAGCIQPGTWSARDAVEQFRPNHELARRGPDPMATERQHARGELTVRERLDLRLDEDSFNELQTFRRHRATGFALDGIGLTPMASSPAGAPSTGRKVFVYAHGFRIFGGFLGEAHAAKIHKIMDLGAASGAPLLGLNDGAGARMQDGVTALAGYGGIFRRSVPAWGIIPQIGVMLGPCVSGASYSSALTDLCQPVKAARTLLRLEPCREPVKHTPVAPRLVLACRVSAR